MINKIILMYHDVYKNKASESGFQNSTAIKYKVPSDDFESHVKYIYGLIESGVLGKGSIEFTFDDGGVSFYEVIAPILEKYNFKGVFFITTKYIGTDGFLSESDIVELDKRGHVIGAHSHTHPSGMKDLSNEVLKNEWNHSIKCLNDILNKGIIFASIPGGSYSDKVFDVLFDLGVTNVYTSKPATNSYKYKNSNIYGRFDVNSTTSLASVNKIVTSSRFRRKLIVKNQLMNVIKVLLGNSYFKIRKMISDL